MCSGIALFTFVFGASVFNLSAPLTQFNDKNLNTDLCPYGVDPQLTTEGYTLWCQNNIDCKPGYICTMIEGLTHFGEQISYCCPLRMLVCLSPLQPGYGYCGKELKRMYYFDLISLRCKPFEIVECYGINRNRFLTEKDCEEFCDKNVCDVDEKLLVVDGKPWICANQICPRNYECRYDPLFRRHVCCGERIQVECPLGQESIRDPDTSLAIKCNLYSICPPNSMCILPEIKEESGICCSTKIIAKCPINSISYLNPITNAPDRCTVGVTVCEQGFVCANEDPSSIIGFCCSYSDRNDFGTTPLSTSQVLRKYTVHSITHADTLEKFTKPIRLIDIQRILDNQLIFIDEPVVEKD